MEDYILPLGIDSNPILQGFKDMEAGLDKVENKANETKGALKNAFSGSANAAKNLDDTLERVAPTLKSINAQAKNVENGIKGMKNATSQAFDEKPLNIFQSRLQKIKNVFNELKTGIKLGISDGIKQAGKDVEDFGKKSNRVAKENTSAFGGLGTMIAGVFGGNIVTQIFNGIISLGKQVIETTANFQRMEAVLTNTLGSNSEAKKAMNNIVDFASKTPFQVDEITESFIKFANRGIILTQNEMTKLGDIASSQGKSFNQLAEAALDAQNGEFERLKEFGIKGSKAGDQVTLSFKNVTKSVKNNAQEIQAALVSFGELGGVKGGMEAISKTLGGQLSNLQDNFTSFLKTIGDGASTGLASAVGFLNDTLSFVNKLITSGFVAKFFDPITSSLSYLYDVGKRVVGVIYEWGVSNGVFKVMKEYVNEGVKALGGLINFVGLLIDATVDFFTETKLGQGIISVLTTAFKGLLNYGTFVFKVLQEIPYVFIAMRAAGSAAINNLVSNFKILGENLEQIRLKVKKAFTFDDAESARLQAEVDASERRKNQLEKNKVDPKKAAADAYRVAKAEDEARAKAREEQRAKERAKSNVGGGDVLGLPSKPGETPAEAQKEAKKKAIDEAKKLNELKKTQSELLLKYTRELKDAEIEAMENGFAKERAIIEENFKRKEEDLKKDYAEAVKKNEVTKETESKYLQLLEQNSKNKISKLNELKEKESLSTLALQLEASKEILTIQAQNLDIELKLIDIEFEEKKKAVREKYKGYSEIIKTLEAELDKAKGIKKTEATQNDEKRKIEETYNVQIAIAKAYGYKMLGLENNFAEAEQELAKGNSKTLLKIKNNENLLEIALELAKQKELLKVIENDPTKKVEIELAKAKIESIKKEFKDAIKSGEGTIKLDDFFDLSSTGSGDVAGALSKAFNFKLEGGDSLADMLGLDEESAKAITESFTSIYNVIQQAYSEMIQGQIDEKDRQIEALDEQISKSEELYNHELELQKQGYANNANAKADEVENLKAQRDKEQADKEALLVKQNKMAQTQIGIQTAVTVSSMIVGLVQAMTAPAAIPIVGVAMGIAAAAALLSGIMAIKAKAKEIKKDGGYVEGRSHDSGGEKYYSNTNKILEIEGGEFVTKKRQTKKFGKLLEAINDDNFTKFDKNDEAFRSMLHSMGIHLEDEAIEKSTNESKEVRAKEIFISYGKKDTDADNYLKKISENTSVLAEDVKNRVEEKIVDGYKIIQQGNVTRRIKLNNV